MGNLTKTMREFVLWNKKLQEAGKNGDHESVRSIIEENCEKFNAVNCCTGLQWLARLGGSNGDGLCRKLADRILQCVDECEPRNISSILWSLAKLEGLGPQKRLLHGLARRGSAVMGKFQGQEISISVWGLGKIAGARDPKLVKFVEALLDHAERKRVHFNGQGLASLWFGLGKFNLSVRKRAFLVPESQIGSLGPQELVNMLCGMALVRDLTLPRSICASIHRTLLKRKSEMLPRHVGNVIWAMAKLKEQDVLGPPLTTCFDLYEELLLTNLDQLGSKEFSMCMWSVPIIWSQNNEKKCGLARRFQACLDDKETLDRMDAHQLATITLSFAKMDETLFANESEEENAFPKLLMKSSMRKIEMFNLQDLESLLSGLAKLGLYHRKLLQASMEQIQSRYDDDPDEDGFSVDNFRRLVNLIWAIAKCSTFGVAKVSQKKVNKVLELVTTKKVMDTIKEKGNPRDLSNLAWGVATLKYRDETLMERIGDAACEILPEFNAQELSKLLYAFQTLNINHEGLLKSSGRERTEEFVINSCTLQISQVPGGGRFTEKERERTGTTGGTGEAMWQDSVLLAKYLDHIKDNPAQHLHGVLKNKKRKTKLFQSFQGLNCVELGAGVGLCSVAAACLGMNKVVATDNDENVLDLLRSNVEKNTKSSSVVEVKKLDWNTPDCLNVLELDKKPEVVLGSGIVYGKDHDVWNNLAERLDELCGQNTVVFMAHGNGAAPLVHQLEGHFYDQMKRKFKIFNLPLPQNLKRQYKGCQVHACIKKSKKRLRQEEHQQQTSNGPTKRLKAN